MFTKINKKILAIRHEFNISIGNSNGIQDELMVIGFVMYLLSSSKDNRRHFIKFDYSVDC